MTIRILVHPNSRKPRIEQDSTGELHVYVSEPPVDDKANGAVIKALARHFEVSKSQVKLVGGAKSKIKLIEICQQ